MQLDLDLVEAVEIAVEVAPQHADGVRRHVRADAAIVTGAGINYVIAIYARQIEDTRWTVDNDALVTGARVSRMVFDYFSARR